MSINHRLNILGYLDLSVYGEKYKNSANLSIIDTKNLENGIYLLKITLPDHSTTTRKVVIQR